MAAVQNNANGVPTAAETAAPATVVAAVTQPDTVQTVNLVAQSDTTAAKDEKKTTSEPSDKNKHLPPTTNAQNAGNPTSTSFRGQPDDFYSAIFYFSGMGSVIGSALSEGVYVAEQYRKNAIDADDIQQERQAALTKIRGNGPLIGYDGQIRDDVVITARGQAQNLSTDFQKLQTLLESLPVFTGNPDQLPPTGGDRRGGEIDQPIHGELYFRCKERFPVQPTAAVSRQMQPSPHDSLRSGASGDFATHQPVSEIRRRQNYDDAVLADVARAAVDAFPLLPPPRQPGSRGSATPVQELQQQDDQASRRARRRDANSAVTASSPSPSGFGYQQQFGRGTPTSSLQSPHVY